MCVGLRPAFELQHLPVHVQSTTGGSRRRRVTRSSLLVLLVCCPPVRRGCTCLRCRSPTWAGPTWMRPCGVRRPICRRCRWCGCRLHLRTICRCRLLASSAGWCALVVWVASPLRLGGQHLLVACWCCCSCSSVGRPLSAAGCWLCSLWSCWLRHGSRPRLARRPGRLLSRLCRCLVAGDIRRLISVLRCLRRRLVVGHGRRPLLRICPTSLHAGGIMRVSRPFVSRLLVAGWLFSGRCCCLLVSCSSPSVRSVTARQRCWLSSTHRGR